jgi:hypothetical protein
MVNAKLKNLRRGLKLWAKSLSSLKQQIEEINEVIKFLDILEEFRPLNIEEWCLRNLLKAHMLMLLKQQNTYWKQRGKIKWVKLGDENTKFFHTRATINFRHNHIAMIKNDENMDVYDHDSKAEIL